MFVNIPELYRAFTRLIIRKSFALWQFFGFHISANNFYEPIPDTRELDNSLWSETNQIVGIDFNLSKQVKLLKLFTSKYKNEYDKFPQHKTKILHQYYLMNGEFETVDAEILHCMIRYFKPKKVIEIGSGFSTMISANAISTNTNESKTNNCRFTAIEPYPQKRLPYQIPGLSEIIPKKVQDVSLREFKKLGNGDILFIDSSHMLNIGSDVQYEYLQILPNLNVGVIIHIHDIFLPMEYPKKWIFEYRKFWNEQYFVQALLMFNPNFEIIWSGAAMHKTNNCLLERAFKSYNSGQTPGSLWIRKIK